MSASVLSKDSVIVGYSLSGEVRSVRDALAIGRQYGATTLAVTSPDSALAGLADVTLPLALREDRDLYMSSSAKYAMLVAVDALATSVAEQIGPDVIERTRRVRQSLADQNLGDPALPIGD